MFKFFRKNSLGFSLIEMMISLGIVTAIITLVVINQSRYTDRLSLTNAADELSAIIYQAQNYAVAVRERAVGTADFSAPYGVAISSLASGDYNTSYIFFADRDNSQAYWNLVSWSCPSSGNTECLSKTAIPRGNRVQGICVIHYSGPDTCGSNITRVDIIFKRPESDAQINVSISGGFIAPSTVKGVRVNLVSPGGVTSSVTVLKIGQISVQ